MSKFDEETVARALHELYVPIATTRLRKEEAQKAREIAPLLVEIDRLLGKFSPERALVLVDAAAGRGYVSLLSAKLLLVPAGRAFRWVLIEREEKRIEACRQVARRHGLEERVELRCAEVGDADAWPPRPDLVVALHACGPAADQVIERAITAEARALLIVPCCVSKAVAGHRSALAAAKALGVPSQTPVRRRLLEALIAAERTLTLEARGYLTDVVEFCAPGVTPHNLVWRGRRLGDVARMRRAQAALAKLRAPP